MNKKLHIFFLFLTALIWGTAFVAQRMGAEHVEAFTYLAWRSWAAPPAPWPSASAGLILRLPP